MHSLHLPSDLYQALQRQAKSKNTTPEALIASWVAQDDNSPNKKDEDSFTQQVIAFEQMRPTLMDTHAGQFVAIHKGQLVASGTDKLAVLHQVYDTFGDEAICYVEQVSPSAPRTVKMPSAHLIQP